MTYDLQIGDYLKPLEPQPTSLTSGGALAGKIQCILFDIYGTLFISGSGDINLAGTASTPIEQLDTLVRKYEIEKAPQALVAEFHDTISIHHRRLKNEGIDYPEIEVDKIWQQILGIDDIQRVRNFAVEYELTVNPVYPMPHLEDLLAACRQHHLIMGVVSNAQFFTPLLFEWFLGIRMEQLGFESELIFLSYRLGRAKPSVKLFEMAAATIKEMGLSPTAAVFVGNDMLNDIYPARSQGFQTALFAGDARSLRLRPDDPCCRNLSADLILTDLSQLIDHIT